MKVRGNQSPVRMLLAVPSITQRVRCLQVAPVSSGVFSHLDNIMAVRKVAENAKIMLTEVLYASLITSGVF